MQTTLGTNLQSPDPCMDSHNAEPIDQPVSKGRNHTILISVGENHVVRHRKTGAGESLTDNGSCVRMVCNSAHVRG